MRLNVINTSSLVALAASAAGCKVSNGRFGAATRLTDKTFKYVVTGVRKEVLLVERVDLGELFAGLPQDISEITHQPNSVLGEVDVMAALGIDPVDQEPPMLIDEPEIARAEDELGQLFFMWQAFVGLYGLSRHEVDLSTSDNVLYIDARNAAVYRGTVAVKFKKDPVNE